MSMRIDKSWLVLESIENAEHDRCVDLFRRADGSFGFEAFRRDVEDAGLWTAVAYHSGAAYASIWDKERNEAPLKTITRSQSDQLGELLATITGCNIFTLCPLTHDATKLREHHVAGSMTKCIIEMLEVININH